jgi:hypothetical protein
LTHCAKAESSKAQIPSAELNGTAGPKTAKRETETTDVHQQKQLWDTDAENSKKITVATT